MRTLVLVGLALTLTTGCVGKQKYTAQLTANDQLQSQLDGVTRAMNELAQDHDDTVRRLEETEAKLLDRTAETGELEASIADMKLALDELERQREQTEESLASYKELVAKFQAMIDAGTLSVKVVDGRMVVELATDVLFGAGSATLSRDGRGAIEEVAAVLASISDREFQVGGHTDNDPIHTDRFPSNWYLGSARAIAVTSLLIDSGLPANRVSAASYGETRPSQSNATKDGKAANRRIEIAIVPDLASMPGYEELQALSGDDPAPPEATDPDGERPVKVITPITE